MSEDPWELLEKFLADQPVRPSPGERERFATFLAEDGCLTGADRSGLQAEGEDCTRWYRPKGGLTEADYDFFGVDEPGRAVVARGVIENLLRLRGFPTPEARWAISRMSDEDILRLIESGSIEEAADGAELKLRRIRETGQDDGDRAAEKRLNPVGDWSRIVTGRGEYILKPAARRVIPALYKAHRSGRTISATEIMKNTGTNDPRIDNIFRRSRVWKKDNTSLVGPDPHNKGFYRLNL